MFFNAALFSGLLLSPVVLALPSWLGARIARRGESSRGNDHLEMSTGIPITAVDSANFAGAWLSEHSGTFSSVAGTFVVPTASGSNGSSAVIWLALDGISCLAVSLGAGVSINVGDQGVNYTAWYQWYPDFGLQSFSDSIPISAGDVLNLTVTTWSLTGGVVTIQNLNNNQVASETLNSSTPLCRQDVQWSVAVHKLPGSQPPLADFGTVTLTNAHATGENIWFSPFGANTRRIVQDGRVLTYTTTEETSVTIQYT